LQTIEPHFDGIEAGLAELTALRGKPAGSLRINSVEHASGTILGPALRRFLPSYPDIRVEVINDYGLTDIVADRFDAGIRLGEQVAQDMIAMRIGPDFRMAVVGAPSYFARRARPGVPQDLTSHTCIGLRLPTSGGLYIWPFAKGGREMKIRVEGQMVFNTITMMLDMALAGLGLAHLPEDVVRTQIDEGALVQVLPDWCPPISGYHLYYPSRRQPTAAFTLLTEALRYRDIP
jgi:DNA-binding transcriptional LysR family regulator